MGIIHALDYHTVVRIAAGEVIDRPASVVRELVDNALDANATEIEVSVNNGGLFSIEVLDNGIGLSPEDLAICYHNHTTSKISSFEDIEHLSTLGFRGEALASIASVAKLEILSRTHDSLSGHRLVVHHGEVAPLQEVGMGYGTTVRVSELFEHLPARKKFLQSPIQEGKLIFRELVKKMLVFPECGFLYRSDGREKFRSPVRRSFLERIVDMFGDISAELIESEFEIEHGYVKAFLGQPTFLKPQRNMQFFAVNRRIVEWKSFPFLVSQVYGNLIPPQRHPVVFLFVEIDPSFLDVNVHPMKREVRFRQERVFQTQLYEGLRQRLQTSPMGRSLFIQTPPFPHEEPPLPQPYLREEDEKFASSYVIPEEVEKVFFSDGDNSKISTSPSLFSDTLHPSQKEEDNKLFGEESDHFDFHTYRLIGDLFSTYLLLEKGDEVLLVDQHAAHERIRYEEIKRLYQQTASTQELLYPLSLELPLDKYEEIFEYQEALSQLGFEIEPFGTRTVIIRSIPWYIEPSQAQEACEACLQAFGEGWKTSALETIDEALKQMACKTAVKARERLSAQEAWGLLERLQHTPHASSCPHGRPTFLKLPRQELEKLFKRTGF